jgi:hypothetical protein
MNVQLKDITVTARDGHSGQPRALLHCTRHVEVRYNHIMTYALG